MQKILLTLTEKWHIHSLQTALENNDHKVLSNVNILMVIAREHRLPDIVYTEKQKSKCQVINIATFSDKVITMKQQQKMAIIRPIVRNSDCRM